MSARIAGWTTRRHARYATRDIPVSTIASISAEVFARLEEAVMPAVASMYALHKPGLSMRDVFIVKYDATTSTAGGGGGAGGGAAEVAGQRGLEMHEDGSDYSFNALLSDPATDFRGGGTRFEGRFGERPVHVARGEVLVHAGKLRHEGVAIDAGKRYVMVGFLKYRRPPSPDELGV